ncbi:hypothetical protein QMK34_45175, partial [Amycolatopsis sp. H20-H5]|nr:hypothetical protein [Amycolatopsis sp. H20-H5]
TAATANDVVRTASITFGLGGAVPSAGYYDIGPGVVATFIALGLATLTALAAVVAGVVEREDAEDESRASGAVLTPVVAAGVLAIVAFGLPTFTAPDYVPAGLWSNFDIPSWGLLATILVVLGALALAVRARPVPSAAALTGVALLMALRAAELPLVGSSIAGATAAAGFWLSLAAVAASLLAAVMAATGARRTAG